MPKGFEDAEFRDKISQQMSQLNQERWEDPEFREKQRQAMTERWVDPKFQEKHRQAMTKLWEDPEFREMMSQNRKRKDLTASEIQNIRERIQNGESFRSIANVYQVAPTTVSNIARQKSHQIRTLQDDWVRLTTVAKETGFLVSTIRNWAERDGFAVQEKDSVWCLEQTGVQHYVDLAKKFQGMIPLTTAAPLVGLSYQRLLQLKDVGKITTLPIGGRYYVDPKQLKQELNSRRQSK